MEEILILILQLLLETAIDVLAYYPFDWPWSDRDDSETGAWLWGFALLGIGMGLGSLFNLVHPHVLIPYSWLRIVSLLLIPMVNGFFSCLLAQWRRDARHNTVNPVRHFFYAFSFTFGFVLIRFAYGVR